MKNALRSAGIDIGCINYQENGNWAYLRGLEPRLHVHLYGRTKSAKLQEFGQALFFLDPKSGFYDGLEHLNEGDIEEIRGEIQTILKKEKYEDYVNLFY